MSYTFIDLFAGIGGLRLAMESTGAKCVYSNEWNKFSRKTYEANFHEIPDDDITQVDAKDIPDHDILVGGFPCQPFSIAGVSKKNSLGRKTGFEDETQGTLFFDVCRILAEKRPKAFFLENVKLADHVQLVVPKQYIKAYPPAYRNSIWPLKKFIAYARETAA